MAATYTTAKIGSQTITKVGDNIIDGADDKKADILATGSGISLVRTGAKNDIIETGDGKSFIDAGDGKNSVLTGKGSNVILTGKGADFVEVKGAGNNISTCRIKHF